jgi:hypothetical protein
MHIPIPNGLQIPADGDVKPFKLTGTFVAMGDHLMPLQLNGLPVIMPKDQGEDSMHEAQEGPQHEAGEGMESGGEGQCCPECGGSGKMEGSPDISQNPHSGNSFVVAIERGMKRK